MEYRIAIPSYKRQETIEKKTLNYLLSECKLNPSVIDVFVANQEEYLLYQHLTKRGVNVIIGLETLRSQRNFITKYYTEGTKIICFDDDVDGLYKKKGNKLEKFIDLNPFFNIGFAECAKNKTKLWGITAVLNGFYMNNKISNNLKYIVGCFFGQIIDHSPALQIYLEDKEDFERTIKYYKYFGSVVRLNMFAPKTDYYKEKGGMQITRTEKRVTASAIFLAKNYPQYCKINLQKKSQHTEIKLNSKAK